MKRAILKLVKCLQSKAQFPYFFILLICMPGLLTAQDYSWSNVTMGGGGFVTGIIPNKSEAGLIYARTDVGGAYRWDAATGSWIQLMDWVSEDQVGLMGIESLATDPQEPNKLYMLAGTSYFNDGRTAVLISEDYGASFTVVDVTNQFRAHGNGMGRQSGEKMVVDPNQNNIIYTGTRWNGLFKSTNSGSSWARLPGLDVTTTPNENGISFVVLDAASGTAGNVTQTIFAGISRFDDNLYRSTDGGESFELIEGGPEGLMPQRAVLGGDDLYITYANGAGPHPHWAVPEPMDAGMVMKYNTQTATWTDITPAGYTNAFGGVDVDPNNPQRVIISTVNIWMLQEDAYGDRFFLSDNGGTSWVNVVERGFERDENGYDWILGQSIHWSGSIVFDPADTQKVWVTSGNGVYSTDNIDASPVNFKFNVRGFEETVPLDAISIPNGPLVSVMLDYDGFVHDDVRQPGILHRPGMGNTYGLAYAAQNPSKLLRFGSLLYKSDDMGASWEEIPGEVENGRVAIGADGQTFIIVGEGANTAYRSTDDGASWTAIAGLGFGSARSVADPINPDKFYAYNPATGRLLLSEDRGENFEPKGSPGSNGSRIMRAALGHEGHLWLAMNDNGLMRSTDGGESFSSIDAVTSCAAVGLGKNAPESDYHTLFIWGTINSVRGIFRSTDEGATWVRVNDDEHQFGGPGNGQFVQGDMNVFGRVYMSTVGRGIAFGEADDTCFPDLISPRMQLDEGEMSNQTYLAPEEGAQIVMSPEAVEGGSWQWEGPNNFSATTREITISELSIEEYGIYSVIYTNAEGCESAPQTFTLYTRLEEEEVITSVHDHIKQQLEVFPNPSSGAMTIQLPEEGFYTVILSDLNGKKVSEFDITPASGHAIAFDMPLQKGVYILKVKGAVTQLTSRVLIE